MPKFLSEYEPALGLEWLKPLWLHNLQTLLVPGSVSEYVACSWSGMAETCLAHTSGALMQLLARDTELFTGAELEGLCREAALAALREDLEGAYQVAARHFAGVRQSMRSGLTPLMLQACASFQR